MRSALWKYKILRSLAMAALLATAPGCLQLDLVIEMQDETPGATLTERLRFSEALLELDHKSILDRHLTRAGAEARMQTMGQGIELVSHTRNRFQDGSRESVTVYRIPDIEALRFPNPFVQNNPPAPMLRLRFNPVYKRVNSYDWPGQVHIHFASAGAENKDGIEASIPADTPLDLQLYRDLHPVFADMMKDFAVKVTLKLPDQPGGRRRQDGDQSITLLHFNDTHLDRHAEAIVRNEEAMVSALQLKLGDDAITQHTKNFPHNRQVSVHRGRSNYGSTWFIMRRPTSHLYQRFFAGRPKSEGGDQ